MRTVTFLRVFDTDIAKVFDTDIAKIVDFSPIIMYNKKAIK